MNIFIGNLSHNVTEGDLCQAFETFGQVASATVIKDEQSGRSRGFGFVDRCVSFPPCSAHAPYDDLHHYYNEIPFIQEVRSLTICRNLTSLRLNSWDERQRKKVRFDTGKN